MTDKEKRKLWRQFYSVYIPGAILPREVWGLTCGATTRAGTPCKRKDLWHGVRCPLHGGRSTGPKTAEGKRRASENGKCPKKSRLHDMVAYDSISIPIAGNKADSMTPFKILQTSHFQKRKLERESGPHELLTNVDIPMNNAEQSGTHEMLRNAKIFAEVIEANGPYRP